MLVEIAGWSGARLILLAYLLLSMGRLTGRSALYQGMNVVGAAGFAVNGWWHGALPSASLMIWLLIGAWALWRIWTSDQLQPSRHSSESWNPSDSEWTPAYAGVTKGEEQARSTSAT